MVSKFGRVGHRKTLLTARVRPVLCGTGFLVTLFLLPMCALIYLFNVWLYWLLFTKFLFARLIESISGFYPYINTET